MNFYKLFVSYNRQKAADIYQLPETYDLLGANHPSTIPIDEFDLRKINFFDIITNPKGKLSDFINTGTLIGGLGFLISPKVKEVFENYSLPPHRYYHPVNVIKGSEKYHYYRIHIIYEDFWNWVNFEKSTFIMKNKEGASFDVHFSDKEEFLNKKSSITSEQKILKKEIVLSDSISRHRDLIFFNRNNFSCIISESLKNALVEKSVSGLDEMELIDWVV